MDQNATMLSIRMVSKLATLVSLSVQSQISEKELLRIADPVINLRLNQKLDEKISNLPLQIVDMAFEQHGQVILLEILELIGEPISTETRDHVFKTILLAKDKARRKWVNLPISKEYTKI